MFLSKFTSNRIFCARNFAVISYRHLKGVDTFDFSSLRLMIYRLFIFFAFFYIFFEKKFGNYKKIL